jgi:hypothetical protein
MSHVSQTVPEHFCGFRTAAKNSLQHDCDNGFGVGTANAVAGPHPLATASPLAGVIAEVPMPAR